MRLDLFRIEQYSAADTASWNRFVSSSRNGTFLHDRDFMDYHADRFDDSSLVVRQGPDDVVAVLPACVVGEVLVSHAGLTYGGWITDGRMTTAGMLRVFELLRAWSEGRGLSRLRYKAIPWCYHRLPSDEDLYALFVNHAALVRSDVSAVIDLKSPLPWSKGRNQALKTAGRSGVTVRISDDLADFHLALEEVLRAHNATPTHSLAELELLKSRFDTKIILYAAELSGTAAAYALVFDCGQTVHTQYLASRPAGRAAGGLDAIIAQIQSDYQDRRYLSFGVSTEGDGRTLNFGLAAQKEMFGARAMVCSTYEMSLGRSR